MNRIISPSVEATKDFILIRIPKSLISGSLSTKKISGLERGLQESMSEAAAGKLTGPFRNGRSFLRALKNREK